MSPYEKAPIENHTISKGLNIDMARGILVEEVQAGQQMESATCAILLCWDNHIQMQDSFCLCWAWFALQIMQALMLT